MPVSSTNQKIKHPKASQNMARTVQYNSNPKGEDDISTLLDTIHKHQR